jgi:hypothetical protein
MFNEDGYRFPDDGLKRLFFGGEEVDGVLGEGGGKLGPMLPCACIKVKKSACCT